MTESAEGSRKVLGPLSLTVSSLFAMAVGIAIGAVGHETQSPLILGLSTGLQPIIALWTSALQMVVVPLASSYLFLAVAKPRDVARTGKAVGFSIAVFCCFLLCCSTVTALTSPRLFDNLLGHLHGVGFGDPQISVPAGVDPASQTPVTFSQWLGNLIPRSFPRALVEEQMLSTLIAVLLFAFAATRLRNDLRDLLVNFAQAIADVMMILVRWILMLLPVAVFGISLAMATNTGVSLIGPLSIYIVILSLLLFVFTLLFYLVAFVIGRRSLTSFARAVFPAQVVAIGTRSSMACLQPLMEGAVERLRMPRQIAELAIPLSVSIFRVNVSISSPFKFLFLAHVYGIDLDTGQLLTFITAILLLSFGSPGIPTRVVGISLPFYLAAGIPIEGVILLGAIDAIPDMFKTLLNVTASMSVSTIVARFFQRDVGAEASRVQPSVV